MRELDKIVEQTPAGYVPILKVKGEGRIDLGVYSTSEQSVAAAVCCSWRSRGAAVQPACLGWCDWGSRRPLLLGAHCHAHPPWCHVPAVRGAAVAHDVARLILIQEKRPGAVWSDNGTHFPLGRCPTCWASRRRLGAACWRCELANDAGQRSEKPGGGPTNIDHMSTCFPRLLCCLQMRTSMTTPSPTCWTTRPALRMCAACCAAAR